MKFPVYCVRDRLIGYGLPVLRDNDSVASRSFEFDVTRDNSPYLSHPDDYQLFRIGEFDTDTAEIVSESPILIANASDFRKDS